MLDEYFVESEDQEWGIPDELTIKSAVSHKFFYLRE